MEKEMFNNIWGNLNKKEKQENTIDLSRFIVKVETAYSSTRSSLVQAAGRTKYLADGRP